MSEKKFVLQGFLMMHQAITRHLNAIENQVLSHTNPGNKRMNQLQKSFEFYWKFVEEHHLGEDHGAFPALASRSQEFARALPEMAADHHLIDELVVMIGETAVRIQATETISEREDAYADYANLITRFREVLLDHLNREEAIFVPAIAESFSPEEQMAMEAAVFAKMTPEHLGTMIPWIISVLAEEEKAAVLASMPPQIGQMYETVWKTQYEQTTAAFAA